MSTGTESGGLSREEQNKLQNVEIEDRLHHIDNKILILSGKGGVGKSSVATYLSVALARRGKKIGLMDVDLHGPSIPRMLGMKGNLQPSSVPGKAIPVEVLPNLHVISIEVLMGENKDTATIWRGPLKIGVIRQFISDIEWSDLDYLIIDSPPGTGDEPLTVAQTIPDASAVIVTTPQEVSLADVRKSINFCREVKMRILGIVENMSGLKCPYCGKIIDLFRSDGGQLMAKKEGLRLLASLPIEPEVVKKGDMGDLSCLDKEDLPFTEEFQKLVDQIEELAVKRDSTSIQQQDKDEEKGEATTNDKVVIAVPAEEGKLCEHFGHCKQFVLIETENGTIKSKSSHTPPAHQPGVLPRWLHEQGADIIIAGGMGESARHLFEQNGIKVIIGAPMESPESLVSQYLSNTLESGDNLCDH